MTGNILFMNNSIVFIDGGYLHKIIKEFFVKSDIDYLRFSELICKKTSSERLRTYYYHCKPFVRNDKNRINDQKKLQECEKFFRKLRRLPRFEVKEGDLQFLGYSTNGYPQFRQKMVDVLMSLDISDKSFENQIQHAILIAGDRDFIPAIKKAKNYGVIVHLFHHPSRVHDELLDIVDESHILSENFLNKCRINGY